MRNSRPLEESRQMLLARSVPRPARNVVGDPVAHVKVPGATSSPADRHEVVHANALHDEELAWAIALPVHVMRRLSAQRSPGASL